MPRPVDMDLEQSWRERFQEFKSSGLSVRRYCRFHALREHTFFWWRRALAKRDRLRQSRAQQRHSGGRHSRQFQDDARAFVPVQLISDPIGAACMEIRLGTCVLRVPTTIEEQALRQAIRVIHEEARGC